MKGKNDIKELGTGIDDPLENPAEDCLDRSAFAKRIFEITEGTPLSTNMTIGIHGAWGSGKTTTMNFLRFYCKEAGHPVALYTPWQFHDKKEAWKGFVSSIDKGIAKWQGKKIGSLKKQNIFKRCLQKIRKIIPIARESNTIINGFTDSEYTGAAITAIGKVVDTLILAPLEGLLEQTKQKVQDELNKVLKDKRLFIFIDDLDRADPDILYDHLMLLNEIVNLNRCVYVIGLDVEVASQVLKNKIGLIDSKEFLEKIINWSFSLPLPTDFEWQELLDKEIENLDKNVKRDALCSIFSYLPKNPRKFKHFLRYISALHKSFLNRFADHELNWKLLYLAQLIRIEFSEVLEKIINKKEILEHISFGSLSLNEDKNSNLTQWLAEISKDVEENKKDRLTMLCKEVIKSVGITDPEELKNHFLVIESPELFTWKEYNTFKKELLSLSDTEITRKITDFIKRASKDKQIERIREFIKMLFRERDKLLSQVADAIDQEEMNLILNDAKDIMRICFLLLDINDIFEKHNPIFNPEIFKTWYGNIVEWAHFKNPKETYIEIRQQEIALAKKLTLKMAPQASLILETLQFDDPQDRRKSFEITHNEIKETFEKAVVEQILDRFRRSNGIKELMEGSRPYRAEKRLLFHVNSLFLNEAVYNRLREIVKEVSKNHYIHENFYEYVYTLFYATTNHLDYTDKEEVIKLLKEKEFITIIWNAVISRRMNLRAIGSLEKKRKIIIVDLLKDENAFPVPEWWEKELRDAKDRN